MATRKWYGMNWIRPEKRLAIYLRDGMVCAYCATDLSAGTKATLDHLRPVSRSGSNDATNLVTACLSCNSARGDMALATWCRKMGLCPLRLRRSARRRLPMDAAKAILAGTIPADDPK